MIAEALRRLCALSLLCGAAMSIAPEGTVKRMTGVVCAAALICAAAQPLVGMDLEAYALELARNRAREEEFLSENGDINDRLNRLVIEQSYEEYIRDKAVEAGLSVDSVDVTAQWDTEGLWVPYSMEISCGGDREAERKLTGTIEAELGIPAERQEYIWAD